MRYLSTRGQSPALSFADAAARGLAPDGGLYVPEALPEHGALVRDGSALSLAEFATRWLDPLVDGLEPGELAGLCARAFASFPADPLPLRALDEDTLALELFHGPTLAFKDVALQWLGQWLALRARRSGERVTVLGATSGDTGAAAVHAVPQEAGRCVILYPHERIAPLAERQLLCDAPPWTRALAVRGDFDAAQALVKALFSEEPLRARLGLTAVNSLNIARLLVQSVYYGFACARLGPRAFERGVRVVVPSGNFGNALSAEYARRMGAPLARITAACNANDTLTRYCATGVYQPGTAVPTLAPAMDISAPSNFERWVWLRSGCDGEATRRVFAELARGVPWRDEPEPGVLRARSTQDAGVLEALRAAHRRYGYVADPHTACALAALEDAPREGLTLVLATAHPAKFRDTLERALGAAPTHPALERLLRLPLRRTILDADLGAVRAALETL